MPGRQNFYPRPPRGGRQKFICGKDYATAISIHALREEGDLVCLTWPLYALLFLSTPSARRATSTAPPSVSNTMYFYPRPPRGGRHHQPVASSIPNPISIHALREEGDAEQKAEEMKKFEFLSTPSARRATRFLPLKLSQNHYFYPRPPRGGRRKVSRVPSWTSTISIHALREEGD